MPRRDDAGDERDDGPDAFADEDVLAGDDDGTDVDDERDDDDDNGGARGDVFTNRRNEIFRHIIW
jgi:hypothetical protein